MEKPIKIWASFFVAFAMLLLSVEGLAFAYATPPKEVTDLLDCSWSSRYYAECEMKSGGAAISPQLDSALIATGFQPGAVGCYAGGGGFTVYRRSLMQLKLSSEPENPNLVISLERIHPIDSLLDW